MMMKMAAAQAYNHGEFVQKIQMLFRTNGDKLVNE
jgi:hypothetical protein